MIISITKKYKVSVLGTGIRSSVKVSEAPSFGQSVLDYAPDCTSSKDYMMVSKEVLETL